jgi:hypothetical protein
MRMFQETDYLLLPYSTRAGWAADGWLACFEALAKRHNVVAAW